MRVLFLSVALIWPSVALAELDGSIPMEIYGSESDYTEPATSSEPPIPNPLPACTSESMDNLSCSCVPDSKVAVCETPTELSTAPNESDAQ